MAAAASVHLLGMAEAAARRLEHGGEEKERGMEGGTEEALESQGRILSELKGQVRGAASER